MYSKSYCPYSQKLKHLLNLHSIDDLKIVELDKQKEMKKMQSVLKRITSRSTVPLLFIGGEFIGGYDDSYALEKQGNLSRLLEEVSTL
ncbi:glutaredoxin [Dictyocaulus viviparus]|uniref:Glutaredoxin n=1 Tax=Dictyocaulus viviparus TaxID=29172 RepID=A0A0D8XBS6_DICVI|nr:glutaredoxin [Dictyocaulus viviparus]